MQSTSICTIQFSANKASENSKLNTRKGTLAKAKGVENNASARAPDPSLATCDLNH